MQGRPDLAQYVQDFAGSHRHITDYLVEEVLDRQPAAIQALLPKTPILARLSVHQTLLAIPDAHGRMSMHSPAKGVGCSGIDDDTGAFLPTDATGPRVGSRR
jgi:ATP/maltotriose-dependent transcriptional regulator MalT